MPKMAIVIIDPLGNFDANNPSVIERHRSYARTLFDSTDAFSIFNVFTCSPTKKSINFDNLYIRVLTRGRKSFPIFIFRAYKVVKRTYSGDCVLIAPDPTLAFLACWIISVILRVQGKPKIPIQLQLHADFSRTPTRTPRAIFLKAMWKFSIARASQIRYVGQAQFVNICHIFRYQPTDTFVAPVPIDFGENGGNWLRRVNRPPSKSFSVAFVGRIHEERGPEIFLQILSDLNSLNQDFDVIVVGSGVEGTKFISKVQALVGKERTKQFGWLTTSQLAKIWSQITILINSAPSESYGRTIREALFHGTKVIAVESSGVRDLLTFVSPNDLHLYNNNSNLSHLALNDFISEPCRNYRPRLQNESKESMKSLILHWQRLAEAYSKGN